MEEGDFFVVEVK